MFRTYVCGCRWYGVTPLNINPALTVRRLETQQTVVLVGGDTYGSHGANRFYRTIMGGCHGWLRGTHPQSSKWRFFLFEHRMLECGWFFAVAHVNRHMMYFLACKASHSNTYNCVCGCGGCRAYDWLHLCLMVEDFFETYLVGETLWNISSNAFVVVF